MQGWIEVFGRLHVVVLHVPIGLLVALAALEVLSRRRDLARERVALSGLTALTALLAASSGWVHGHTEGRIATDTLTTHQWLGLGVALLATVAFLLAQRRAVTAYRGTLVVTLLLLGPTGDLGGEMTHGPGFLLEPLQPRVRAQAPAATAEPAAATPPAVAEGGAVPVAQAAPAATYSTVIAPLLASRCGACHNTERHKGSLILVTPDGLRDGGRNGPALQPGQPADSELLRRMRLPADHEDHMPPPEKPQATAGEIATLEAWISAGAPFEGAFETPR